MACLTDGMLRAHLDGQLGAAESAELEQHCATCGDCRQRAAAIARAAQLVQTAMSSLPRAQSELSSDARVALARFRSSHARHERFTATLMRLFSKPSMWAALTALALVVCLFSFSPARSWAQRLVGMLRVQKITAISIDFDDLERRGNQGQMLKSMAQLLSGEVVVTIKMGEPQAVETRAQASGLAGFSVRLPRAWDDAVQIRVLGEQAFHATIDRDRLQDILDEAGRSDLQLPFALDGATIAAYVPKIVVAAYGQCSGPEDQSKCVRLMQSPSPSVTVPPELNVAEVAEVALQLSGMSAETARGFSRSIDWASTLVLGLPRGTSWRNVEVDGVQGTLLERAARRGREPGYTLLWVKNGIIYGLSGTGSPEDALTLAGTLN